MKPFSSIVRFESPISFVNSTKARMNASDISPSANSPMCVGFSRHHSTYSGRSNDVSNPRFASSLTTSLNVGAVPFTRNTTSSATTSGSSAISANPALRFSPSCRVRANSFSSFDVRGRFRILSIRALLSVAVLFFFRFLDFFTFSHNASMVHVKSEGS